jgi:hypothetical protein
MSVKKAKLPVILYEDSIDGRTNLIPYIEVGLNDEMPSVLFISEYKETGEFEPDAQFGSAPIVDMIIHKYVDFDFLKDKLDAKTYDKVRVALGLKPLIQAQKEGQKIFDKVIANAESNKKNLETNKEAQAGRVFQLGEKVKNKMAQFLEDQNKKEEK